MAGTTKYMTTQNENSHEMPAKTTERTRKACAIVGTAGTWKLAPFNDPSVDILSLNDGYVLGMRQGHRDGLPRMSVHFDLHPIAQMSFHPANTSKVSASEVPAGAYLRPEGHLQWLRSRNFPVFLNEVPAGWSGHCQRFPREDIQKQFGNYITSTPVWMLLWALQQGYTEIGIYGIHLATEWEYLQQRPCMEHWMGVAAAMGVSIILPTKCPLLKAKHVYAYEPKPDVPLHAIQTKIAQTKYEGAQLQKAMSQLKWYERGRKADLAARLQVVNLELADQQQAQRRLASVIHAA